MFSYIKGLVVEKKIDKIILENRGIGYEILVSSHTLSSLSIGSEEKIYTKFIVREDEFILVGFFTHEEQKLFSTLTNVSKVGPKLALSILSTYSPKIIKGLILNSEINMLSKVPGLGKKTAERLILELKDKFDILESEVQPTFFTNSPTLELEAIEALISLGFTKRESEIVVKKIVSQNNTDNIGSVIKKSLLLLNKN